MNIVYKKGTLYVYLNKYLNKNIISNMEDKVNYIMNTYDISNLVIDTYGKNITELDNFKTSYNSTHKSQVIIK